MPPSSGTDAAGGGSPPQNRIRRGGCRRGVLADTGPWRPCQGPLLVGHGLRLTTARARLPSSCSNAVRWVGHDRLKKSLR
eukprot:scaffold2038_cov259-Pinguiococcus_pyrenoidosus.AAC.1